MTVISADHTIYQPPIFKSLTGSSAEHTINESALIMCLQIIMDRTNFECGELARIYDDRKSQFVIMYWATRFKAQLLWLLATAKGDIKLKRLEVGKMGSEYNN